MELVSSAVLVAVVGLLSFGSGMASSDTVCGFLLLALQGEVFMVVMGCEFSPLRL